MISGAEPLAAGAPQQPALFCYRQLVGPTPSLALTRDTIDSDACVNMGSFVHYLAHFTCTMLGLGVGLPKKYA